MRIFTISFLVCFSSLLVSACSTLPVDPFTGAGFTTENIMKIHQGMSSKEILTLFGQPKNVRVSECGKGANQWTCTFWEYGEYPYDTASFTFSGNHNSLKLNNFDIDRN